MNKIKAKKVFVPCGFSGLHLPEYNQYFKDMAKILKSYDATIYMSNTYRDIEYAKKFKVRNILIIPNGADEKEFAMRSVDKDIIKNRLGIRRKDFLILHVGSHTGVKGHKEVISAFKKAAIKNATLLIVGNQGACLTQCTRKAQLNNIFRRNNKLIKILDLSRSETIKAYYAADAFITLSNIECSPLVLFEAAAAGIPFIANKSGNSVEITSWLKNGLIAQSKQDKFGHTSTEINSAVKRIEELYSNKKLRLDYGKSGRNNWQKKYTWSKITNSYQSLYKKLVAKG